MNHQAPVPTLLQRQALAAYTAAHRDAIYQAERSARSLHRAAVAHPFPTMQPEPRQMCAEPEGEGMEGSKLFWAILAVSFAAGYITTMIWRFI